MKRRVLLIASALGALVRPSLGRAQEKIRRVAVLVSAGKQDSEGQARITSLRGGLMSLGWIEGRSIHLDVKFGAGDARSICDYVSAFVTDAADLIVVNSTPALDEVYHATKTIPVVFMLDRSGRPRLHQ